MIEEIVAWAAVMVAIYWVLVMLVIFGGNLDKWDWKDCILSNIYWAFVGAAMGYAKWYFMGPSMGIVGA